MGGVSCDWPGFLHSELLPLNSLETLKSPYLPLNGMHELAEGPAMMQAGAPLMMQWQMGGDGWPQSPELVTDTCLANSAPLSAGSLSLPAFQSDISIGRHWKRF